MEKIKITISLQKSNKFTTIRTAYFIAGLPWICVNNCLDAGAEKINFTLAEVSEFPVYGSTVYGKL